MLVFSSEAKETRRARVTSANVQAGIADVAAHDALTLCERCWGMRRVEEEKIPVKTTDWPCRLLVSFNISISTAGWTWLGPITFTTWGGRGGSEWLNISQKKIFFFLFLRFDVVVVEVNRQKVTRCARVDTHTQFSIMQPDARERI